MKEITAEIRLNGEEDITRCEIYYILVLPYSLEIKRTDFRDLKDLLNTRYLLQDLHS